MDSVTTGSKYAIMLDSEFVSPGDAETTDSLLLDKCFFANANKARQAKIQISPKTKNETPHPYLFRDLLGR